jgi:hypothetical protein
MEERLSVQVYEEWGRQLKRWDEEEIRRREILEN